MTTEPEKIGVDVWMAATIYVDAETYEEAEEIVRNTYAGSREKPNTYDHMNGEDLPLDDDDFMSSAVTLYGLCKQSGLFSMKDTVRDAAPDMLAVLKDAFEYFEGGAGDPDLFPNEHAILSEMRAIIDRAEGRTNEN